MNDIELLPNHWFLFLSVIMKEFMITKSSITEIQNLIVNPKSQLVNSNSEQYHFLFKSLSEIDEKNQIKEKSLFWGYFCPKRIFLKTSGYVQLQGSPSI